VKKLARLRVAVQIVALAVALGFEAWRAEFVQS
jgi:hypothetical protein